MTDDEPLYVDCGPHGKRVAAVVCCHMLLGDDTVGFVENNDDPNNLQAWCEHCEEMFQIEGDRTEAFCAFHDMRIVCCVCYEDLRAKLSKDA